MILNDVIAIILRYFTKFDSFSRAADCVTVVEDRPIMSAEYSLSLLPQTDPRGSRTVSAVGELLV